MSNNLLFPWQKRIRFLTQALILSVAVNIGLVATFIYFVLEEKKEAISFTKTPPSKKNLLESPHYLSNQELLEQYSTLPFCDLITLLENKEGVEEGYKKRDLALASLAAFHFFNLEKGLGSPVIQKREIAFIHQEGQEKIDMVLFPALSEEQWEALTRFAKIEKFPYTSEGLFFELKQGKGLQDSALVETFYLTPEFHTLMTLFSRGGLPLPKEMVLHLLIQGEWEHLQTLAEEQMQVQDLSSLRLKNVLVSYVKSRSLLAAKILLEWDREFVFKKLDDVGLLLFLDLFLEKTESLEVFLKEVLISTRSDAVHRKAAEKLYTFASLEMPDPYDYASILKRFGLATSLPLQAPLQERVAVVAPASVQPSLLSYTVQEGDTLWKIARKHKVSVEKLKEKNSLKSDKVRVGRKLEIP